MFEKLETSEGTYTKPIVLESRMTTIEEARQSVRDKNPEASEGVLARQELIEVKYLSGENEKKKVYLGQWIVDKELARDIIVLFEFLKNKKDSIEKIIPISKKPYEGDDDKSMADNNSSGFNYRTIEGTNILSLHGFGFAIDINPRENPIVKDGEPNYPRESIYNTKNPNTLTSEHKIVKFLKSHGFEWGGDWTSSKDYHHFEKVIPTTEYIDHYLKNVVTNPNVKAEDVIKRIQTLIANNIAGKYTENLNRLIADEKVKDKIGEKQF